MQEISRGSAAEAESGIGLVTRKRLGGRGAYEPVIHTQFVPRCARCGAPGAYIREDHPLAAKFPAAASNRKHGQLVGRECLCCGAASIGAGPVVTTKAVITGFSAPAIIARLCLAIGRLAFAIKRRIGK